MPSPLECDGIHGDLERAEGKCVSPSAEVDFGRAPFQPLAQAAVVEVGRGSQTRIEAIGRVLWVVGKDVRPRVERRSEVVGAAASVRRVMEGHFGDHWRGIRPKLAGDVVRVQHRERAGRILLVAVREITLEQQVPARPAELTGGEHAAHGEPARGRRVQTNLYRWGARDGERAGEEHGDARHEEIAYGSSHVSGETARIRRHRLWRRQPSMPLLRSCEGGFEPSQIENTASAKAASVISAREGCPVLARLSSTWVAQTTGR